MSTSNSSNTPTHELGLQLKFARIRRGVEQQALARRLGISPALLSFYESGKRTIPPARRLRLYRELAEWGKSDQGDARERLIATIACHGAIKSGEHLSEREMRHLIRQLNRSATPAICPHGDPIIVSISRAELDRRFGRSYRDNE